MKINTDIQENDVLWKIDNYSKELDLITYELFWDEIDFIFEPDNTKNYKTRLSLLSYFIYFLIYNDIQFIAARRKGYVDLCINCRSSIEDIMERAHKVECYLDGDVFGSITYGTFGVLKNVRIGYRRGVGFII